MLIILLNTDLFFVQLNSHQLPMWSSLARDNSAVMALSVFLELAFSSSGITISKRCTQLKADIVEALQCLRCLLKHNMIICYRAWASLGNA